jgi:predicted DCC family thiol-disulfide oxidoreductase YuxK
MEPVTINDPRPLLIYDGDCGFCNYWVRYWQKLTGDRVAYAPYQEIASRDYSGNHKNRKYAAVSGGFVADEPVSGEPVSRRSSLLTGKRQGIS